MDAPKLGFISAKLTRHSIRTNKNEPGRKPEHTEALLEDAARNLKEEHSEEENGKQDSNGS